MEVRKAERRAARGDVAAAASLLARRIGSGELSRRQVELAARLGHPAAARVAPVGEEWHVYDVLASLREEAVLQYGARRLWFDAVRRFRSDVMSRPRLAELAHEDMATVVDGDGIRVDVQVLPAAFEAVVDEDAGKALLTYRALGGSDFRRIVYASGLCGPAAVALCCALENVARLRHVGDDACCDDVHCEDWLEDPFDLAETAELVDRAVTGRAHPLGPKPGDHVIATSARSRLDRPVAGCFGVFVSIERDPSFFVNVSPRGRCAGGLTIGYRRTARVSEQSEETLRQRAALAEILLSPPPA